MWQRKQTIYLMLVVMLMAVVAWQAVGIGLQIIAALVALLAAWTITRFSNRRLQMRLCLTGQMLIVVWVAWFAIDHYYLRGGATRLPLWACLPIVSYIIYYLARLGIKHDDDLVRSADRIR